MIDGPGYCDQWHCLEAGLGYHAPTLPWIAFGLGFGIPGGIALTHALLWSASRCRSGCHCFCKALAVVVSFCFYAGALMVTVYTSGVFPLVICFSIATLYPAVVLTGCCARRPWRAWRSSRTPTRQAVDRCLEDLSDATAKL